MATAYSWHPRIDVANPLWPRAQPLLEDELLSSWLIRNAFAHGCSPLTLTGSLWPRWRCWTLDIDRGLSFARLTPLSQRSGISTSNISSSTLQLIANTLAPDPKSWQATLPWILSLGCRNRRHTAGMQCCPVCMTQEPSYYRLTARLAWHTCCERHQVRLIDCCPKCRAPLQPHRLGHLDTSMVHCDRCGGRLEADIESIAIAPAALAFQLEGDRALSGQGWEGDLHCEPYDWFWRARFVCNVLRAAARSNSRSFGAFREAFSLGALTLPISGLPLEMLPVEERMDLLAGTWKVMQTGERQMREVVIGCALTSGSLSIPAGQSYAGFKSMAEAMPTYGKKKRGPLKAGKPAKLQTVQRLWARLKRKMLRDG